MRLNAEQRAALYEKIGNRHSGGKDGRVFLDLREAGAILEFLDGPKAGGASTASTVLERLTAEAMRSLLSHREAVVPALLEDSHHLATRLGARASQIARAAVAGMESPEPATGQPPRCGGGCGLVYGHGGACVPGGR